jgi:hypothetical protein
VTRDGLHRTPHNEIEMEAREQSSDPKPKKNSKLKGHGKKKGCLEGRGGGKGGGMKEAILHLFNG